MLLLAKLMNVGKSFIWAKHELKSLSLCVYLSIYNDSQLRYLFISLYESPGFSFNEYA